MVSAVQKRRYFGLLPEVLQAAALCKTQLNLRAVQLNLRLP
jgi:hypothetical protein